MMFKFKKFVSVLFSVLIVVTMLSIVSVSAITDFPDVPTSPPKATEATRATESTKPAYIEATNPPYNPIVTVSSIDDEQDVYVENQPFNSTTNIAIIVCAIEGGIICVCLIIIILLLSIKMIKDSNQKTQY